MTIVSNASDAVQRVMVIYDSTRKRRIAVHT
jgi:hypothetical protein